MQVHLHVPCSSVLGVLCGLWRDMAWLCVACTYPNLLQVMALSILVIYPDSPIYDVSACIILSWVSQVRGGSSEIGDGMFAFGHGLEADLDGESGIGATCWSIFG